MTFDYVVDYAFSKIEKSPMIPMPELNNTCKLGLYYIMSIYNVQFRVCSRANWEWVELCQGEQGKPLMASMIKKLPKSENTEKLLREQFLRGELPNGYNERPKKDSQPYGWLSPTGVFIESPWGTHCESAEIIIKSNNFTKEFDIWTSAHIERICSERDFLSEVKGYVLIHNPANDGGYIVSHLKPLTKKQREFLYQYFKDLGDTLKAEKYLKGD